MTKPRTVMCFGDSNTHGTRAMRALGDRRRFPKEQRWPEQMAARLGSNWEVIAEGHPGRTAVFDDPIEGPHKNGQAALPVLLETHRPLDLVIVMLGTNDLKARFNQTALDVALGIQSLVRDILRSDSGPDGAAPRVLAAAPALAREIGTLAEIFAGAEMKSVQLPDQLAHMAERQGVGYVDMSAVAKVDPVDGIHLDAAGHTAIGTAMAQAVLRTFEN